MYRMEKKENLIDVGNYALMYPKAWEHHVGFIERGEEGYPLMEGCEDVDVLSLFGEPFECDTAIMCSPLADERLEGEAYRFALELALNRWPVSFGCRTSGIERAFRAGFLDGNGRMECHLSDGIMSVFSNNRLRRLAMAVLVGDGAVYSCFRPDIMDREGRRKRMEFREYVATRKRRIILLGLSKYSMQFVEQALMLGAEIYVHASFMASRCARMLAEEGACLIDSAAHFITAAGGQASRHVYPDERGGYCYNGRGYGVFSI